MRSMKEKSGNKLSTREVIDLEAAITGFNSLAHHSRNLKIYLLQVLKDNDEDFKEVFAVLVEKYKSAGVEDNNQLYYLAFSELLRLHYKQVKKKFFNDVRKNRSDWLGVIPPKNYKKFVELYIKNVLDYIDEQYSL